MPQGKKGFTIFMDFAKMKNAVVFKKIFGRLINMPIKTLKGLLKGLLKHSKSSDLLADNFTKNELLHGDFSKIWIKNFLTCKLRETIYRTPLLSELLSAAASAYSAFSQNILKLTF